LASEVVQQAQEINEKQSDDDDYNKPPYRYGNIMSVSILEKDDYPAAACRPGP
jgi:hypothetical protein